MRSLSLLAASIIMTTLSAGASRAEPEALPQPVASSARFRKNRGSGDTTDGAAYGVVRAVEDVLEAEGFLRDGQVEKIFDASDFFGRRLGQRSVPAQGG